jgi:hypothetical protein
LTFILEADLDPWLCRAPEILTRTGHGKAVDWWSFGALIYDMLTGQVCIQMMMMMKMMISRTMTTTTTTIITIIIMVTFLDYYMCLTHSLAFLSTSFMHIYFSQVWL